MSRPLYLAVLPVTFALVACGGGGGSGDDGDDDPSIDATVEGDASTPDGNDGPCTTPDDCDWLEPYLREVLGKLTGETEIEPGVTLAARASVGQRDIARNYLVAELEGLGYEVELHAYATGTNVVVRLEPTTGDAMDLVVVGAHFDGVAAGPAAADNGTGTAIVMAIARYLRDVERDHPVEIVFFDQEENGLIGSNAYAVRMFQAGTTVIGVHNVDMVSFDGDGDRALELWSPTPVMQALYETHGKARSIPIQPVTFQYSDHQSFLDRGFPTVGVCEEFVANDHSPHYHQATDTFDKVNFTYSTEMTRLIIDAVVDQLTD